jgi:putative copper resistance protein D
VPDPLICLRAIHFAATLLLTGTLFFRYVIAALPPAALDDIRGRLAASCDRLRRIAGAALGVALLSGFGWVLFLAADASEAGAGILTVPGIVWTFVTETTFGRACAVRAVAGVILFGLLLRPDDRHSEGEGSPRYRAPILAAAIVFAAGLAWAGHAAATEGADGWVHRISDALHVVAASAWVGGLLPLALLLRTMLRSAEPEAMAVVRMVTLRFSMLGLVSVATLLLTGTVNTLYLAGTVAALLGTLYGQLLLIKVAVFAIMLGLASYNRFRLTPRITARTSGSAHEARTATALLARVCFAEATLGLGAIGLVAWLGALPPAIHEDAWWPLPFRLTLSAYFDPELRQQTLAATLLVAAGVLMIGAALVVRRRIVSIALGVAGLAIVIVFGRDLDVLTTEAYPTTFLAPPIDFTPQAIASGQTLFAAHCAACHGPSGKGDGPAAAGLKVPPADLTADHLYGHTDGDLFWRLGVGVDGVMPAFSAILSDDERWRLVAFLQANADAERLASLRGRVTYAAFPAPRFPVQCPDDTTLSAADFAGRSVHLIVAGPGAGGRLDQLAALARSGTGAATLVVGLGPEADGRFCTTNDRGLLTALALYRRGSEADLDGTEFLLDSRWRLRAMWHKGFGISWIDPVIFRRQIAEMDNPQILPGNLKALNLEFGDMPHYYPGAGEGGTYHRH